MGVLTLPGFAHGRGLFDAERPEARIQPGAVWMVTPAGVHCHDNERSARESMDQVERDNWVRIAAQLESSGVTEGGFYQRARAIADGKPDPMPMGSPAMDPPADELH
jgi:hypothetical protein